MSSSRKKIVARKLNREWVAGYLPAGGFTRQSTIEMLALDGRLLTLQIRELKWIGFVRDFNSGEIENPERLLRKSFAGRPRGGEGLWLRVRFEDGDSLEGVAENNLTLLDADGFFLTPPDIRGNTQRLWLPRTALKELEIIAVIGAAAKKKPATEATPQNQLQETLFPTT